jgi:hypothetical protein
MEISTGDEARHPPDTRSGGAPRGGPRSGQLRMLHNGSRSNPTDAACLGCPRRGGAFMSSTGRRAFVEERRRHWRSAARRHAHRQKQDKKPAQGEEGGRDAHSGSAVKTLQAWRGWRRGVGVHGGACSGPAPPRSRTAPPPSGSPRPRHSAAARRRRRGVGLPPPRLLFLYSPLPLPLRRRCSGKGQNPNVGWWRWPSSALPSPCF